MLEVNGDNCLECSGLSLKVFFLIVRVWLIINLYFYRAYYCVCFPGYCV